MNYNNPEDVVRKMPRPEKIAFDSGQSSNFEESAALFNNARTIVVPPQNAMRADVQVALLTTVALAKRTFNGRVFVVNSVGLNAKTPDGATMRSLIQAQGVRIVESPKRFYGQILIGDSEPLSADIPSIRPVFAGWRGGVMRGDSSYPKDAKGNVLSAILASGLAVSEMFNRLFLHDVSAACQEFGFSLWNLKQGWKNSNGLGQYQRDGDKWLENFGSDPALSSMPEKAWFVGLGHLGQAYLWVMESLVRFGCPDPKPTFFLQDIGRIKESTHSTSVLTPKGKFIGERKTRICACDVERFGICTHIVDRKLVPGYAVDKGEPKLVFGGLDSGLARCAWDNRVDDKNFIRIIDAGLGAHYKNFGLVDIYTLPDNQQNLKRMWEIPPDNKPNPYSAHSERFDICGQAQVDNQAVGVPYVGMVAAAFVVSEALRIFHAKGKEYQAIHFDLSDPDSLSFRIREGNTPLFDKPLKLRQIP